MLIAEQGISPCLAIFIEIFYSERESRKRGISGERKKYKEIVIFSCDFCEDMLSLAVQL